MPPARPSSGRHGIDDAGMQEIADQALLIKAVKTVRHVVTYLSVLVGTLALSVSASAQQPPPDAQPAATADAPCRSTRS
jgi:hypothetical protein